jgi:excisionase family DNA binding protein
MSEGVTNLKRRAYSLAELAAQLGVSVAFLRLKIGRKHLRATRLGRRIVVTHEAFERYLAANSK